jgi:hypothetical protein
MRRLLAVLLIVPLAFAATIRLYLKDGGFHLVREYKVLEDRVRYYSTERGDWEEIPLELVDLKKTQAEIGAREQSTNSEAKAVDAEDKAERALRAEIASVPYEKGVFFAAEGKKPEPVKQAEIKMQTSKGRQLLKIMSPLPIVAGRTLAEIDGEHSPFTVAADRPEFYIRLTMGQRFSIVKVSTGKNKNRVAARINLIPVTKEMIEEFDEVDIFRKQVDDDLYKIWPTKPLAPGEYAVAEWQEGTGNIMVWDFAVRTK